MKNFYRLATLTLGLTVLLITWGGVVHNTGSSLACPDWPLCFGQWLPKMEGGVLYEHSHRLLGALVGLCAIGLVYSSSKLKTKQPKLFTFSAITLGVIIFQGVLGGATVLLRLSPLVSTAHLATSQITVGLLLWLCLASRDRVIFAPRSAVNALQSQRIVGGLKWATLFIFLQMCLGAFIRHGGQSMACGVGWDSALLCHESGSVTGSLLPSAIEAQVHMLHRLMALIAFGAMVIGSLPFWRWARAEKLAKLQLMVVASYLLFATQILLGVFTVTTGIAFLYVTAHLLVGMLASINIFAQYLLARECLNPPV